MVVQFIISSLLPPAIIRLHPIPPTFSHALLPETLFVSFVPFVVEKIPSDLK